MGSSLALKELTHGEKLNSNTEKDTTLVGLSSQIGPRLVASITELGWLESIMIKPCLDNSEPSERPNILVVDPVIVGVEPTKVVGDQIQ